MKSKRITSLALSFVLTSSLLTPCLAVNTSGGTGNSEAVVNQDSTHFSVTVPTGLPVAVDKDGAVTVAENAKIINNSYGPVKVSNVSVTPLNSWSIVDYEKDFSKEKIGLKEFGFILNGDEVTIDGNLELTESSWSTISGKSELGLAYSANLGVQKVAQNIDIANVVFTVGWDSANLDFSLSSDSLSIEKGNTGKLSLIGVQTAVWSSSNESVAVVDQEGNIETLDWGTTIISATTNGFTHSCTVIVPKIQTGLTMSQATASLEKGKTLQLSAISNYRGTVVWSSSDAGVVSVDSTGLIVSKEWGTATITATQGDFSTTCVVTVPKIQTGLTMSQSTASLEKGKTLQLSTTSSYRGTIVWSSSNASIATVSQDGTVTSKEWGTATITATQGDFTATCIVTVPKIQTGITMSQATASLEKGNTLQLSTTSNYRGDVVWSSSDASIASVSQTGLVISNDWGTVTITATQGDFKATCVVTVPKIQTGLTMSQATASLKQGVTLQLSATGTYRGTLVWSSSDDSVASVNQTGVVTTHNGGTAIITAAQGGFIATCDVIVDKYVLATDSDFSVDTDGNLSYIGVDDYVEVPHVIKGVSVTSYQEMFKGTSVKGVKSTNTNVTNMMGMFENSTATTLDVSKLDTSNVTNMAQMFYNSSATNLDLSSFNTSNVTNMGGMFYNSSTINLDLSSFNTSNVTDMGGMFQNSKTTRLNLRSFNTSNVTNMGSMFRDSSVTSLDLFNFDTSRVKFMEYMFSRSKATYLNLRSFNTSSVIRMDSMFAYSSVTSLDLSSFYTSMMTSMRDIFNGCSATTGYARSQVDAENFNNSMGKPNSLIFVVK